MDPAKLKVVELRAELAQRGLDTKGNKPALVKRLKEALEEELTEVLPDTSIADTSTEDLDVSQPEPEAAAEPPEEATEPEKPPEASPKVVVEEINDDKVETITPQKDKVEEPQSPQAVAESEDKPQDVEMTEDTSPKDEESNENGNDDEPRAKKSRWGADVAPETNEEGDQPKEDAPKEEEESEAKSGEKRKHSSPSPEERAQRRRSKSPIKEDEPPIDNEKVQLSWYDSDLHLQVDKESFLAARPFHEGAFGFAWAGVRATHGVNTGKVCYEVKITEELKWEDFSKYYERGDRHHRDSSHRHRRHDDDKSKSSKTDEKKPPQNDGDEKKDDAEKTEEKMQVEDDEIVKIPDDDEEEPKAETETKSVSESGEAAVEEKPSEKEPEEKPSEAAATEEKPSEKEPEAMDTSTSDDPKVEEAESKDKPAEEKKDEAEKEEAGDKKTEEEKIEDLTKDDTEEKEEEKKEDEPPAEPTRTHLLRVGWSLLDTSLQLGEAKFSYGYESSAKFVTDNQFTDYGIQFGLNDVVTSFLNVTDDTVSITYAVNGVAQPEAVAIPRSELPEDFVLFPHVLSRNYAFELNLGEKETAWFPKPEGFDDFEFLASVEGKIAGPLRPENRSDCEIILMCGLPASGKSHWVREHVQSNLDKKYTILGNAQLLDKMTVSGDPLKTKYKGHWNSLLDKLQKCLYRLVDRAALRRRNYIIDQTNVFPSAQRRKLQRFEGFKRRAVVVVVGDEEQAKRQSLQEAKDGKDVPDSTVLEMKANMSIPHKGDWLDEVVFAELGEEEAKAMVQKYNASGKEAGYGIQRRFGHRDDRNRWPTRRDDYNRGGNYRDNRNYQNNRYNNRGPPPPRPGGNWHPQRPGGWNRDRRDFRGGAPMGGGSRDWRSNSRGGGGNRDRGGRDVQVNTRPRHQPTRSGGGGGNWGGHAGGGNWGGHAGGGWGNQSWGGGQGQGSWGQGGNWQSGGNQNNQAWKYGGGQNYGGYGGWNYYNQYGQGWGQSAGQASGADGGNQYRQYSQQDWAQYAQQYAQGAQTGATVAPGTTTPK